MCGIIGYTGKNQVDQLLVNGLKTLEYRGYDSAGVAIMQNHGIKIVKREGKVDILAEAMKENNTVGTCGIAHTRWATHGKPSDENSHPHFNCNKTFAVIHNGIIENYQEIKHELIEQGYHFTSETDSEVVPHLLEREFNGNLVETVRKVSQMLIGAYAIAVISSYEPDKIIAVRHETPMIVGLADEGNLLASDLSAIIPHTKNFFRLNNGEMSVITPNDVKTMIIESGKVVKKDILEIDWDISKAKRSGYDHFMRKEIAEQPEVIDNAIRGRLTSDNKINLPELKEVKEDLIRAKRIHIVACGTSYHAGLVAKYMIEDYLNISVETDVASEYRYRKPILNEDDLLIVISQSGETADTLAAVRLAKSKNVPVIGVVNSVNSSIAVECDSVIYLHAGPEIGVASTKAYVSQLVVLVLFTLYLAQLRAVLVKDLDLIVEQLRKLSKYVKDILNDDSLIKDIAMHIKDYSSCFFIGRLVDSAVALEGALKLKEISYIHAEAKEAGELKHGTLALIEDGTPVISLATQKEVADKMHSNIMEVKARGGYIILLTNEEDSIGDRLIKIKDIHPYLSPILTVIPLQLLSYYTSVLRGINPDKPRNLAKSVTVE